MTNDQRIALLLNRIDQYIKFYDAGEAWSRNTRKDMRQLYAFVIFGLFESCEIMAGDEEENLSPAMVEILENG